MSPYNKKVRQKDCFLQFLSASSSFTIQLPFFFPTLFLSILFFLLLGHLVQIIEFFSGRKKVYFVLSSMHRIPMNNPTTYSINNVSTPIILCYSFPYQGLSESVPYTQSNHSAPQFFVKMSHVCSRNTITSENI